MLPSLAPHHHIGIVVPDIDAARAELTARLGVSWGPVLRLDANSVRDGDGQDLSLPTTMCYSTEAPHLELIEEVPGTVWTCNEHSNLHHLGFWSDDLPGASAALVAGGCPLQLCGRAGDVAPTSWVYHGSGLGVRVEVLDAGMRDLMAFLFEPPA